MYSRNGFSFFLESKESAKGELKGMKDSAMSKAGGKIVLRVKINDWDIDLFILPIYRV